MALPKKEEIEKLINEFHEKEDNYLDAMYNDLKGNYLFNILINEQDLPDNEEKDFKNFMDLLLKDYITFYLLQKYEDDNNNEKIKQEFINFNPYDAEHDLILLLIKIRFKEDKNIIKNNKNDEIKIFLFKILWIESNYDYIINILKVYDILSSLLKGGKKELFNDISEYIRKGNVRYIAIEKRNPQHTEEINECFYILLAAICQCITSDKIMEGFICTDDISSYIEKCKEALLIITRLSDDLLLFLNEKNIIEEFLLIINISNKYPLIDDDFASNIMSKLKNLSIIIQTESESRITDLNLAFMELNKYIINQLNRNDSDNYENDNEDKNDDYYYELLSSFYLKELTRLPDINYRANILEQILINDKVIKKSLKSFKLLIKDILQPEVDKFKNILSNLTIKSDNILQMFEKKECTALSDTLFYLFEKNTFMYFEKAELIDEKRKSEKFKTFYDNKNPIYIILDEPLSIFEDCIKYLEGIIKKPDTKSKNKKMKKLFSLAYIRVYIYKFIHILDENPTRIDESKIIEIINGKDKEETKLRFMIKLYLYKVVFNIIGKDMSKMKSDKIQDKFKLKQYKNFVNFIEKDKEETFLKQLLLPSEDLDNTIFENEFLKIKRNEKNKYNDENIDINEIRESINDYGDDMFYLIYANLLSGNLYEVINYNKSQTLKNFWENWLEKIYSKDIKNLLKILFNVENLKIISGKYNIGRSQIEMLLYSMRFCFKTIISGNENSIYKNILSGDMGCLKETYFIGNDISENNYYSIYIKLKEHFNKCPKQDGAYICLCKTGFFQYIPNGYPTIKNNNEKCPHCGEPIGYSKGFLGFNSKPVNREGYVRIFEKLEDINNEDVKKLNQIYYMTLDEFYKKYIEPKILKEKPGIYEVSKKHFQKSNKIIRKLNSQLSYRLLNFILYSHLFFANIMNN